MKVALCQTNCGDDVAANERQVFGLLEEAAAGGVDLAALPEVWPCQGSVEQVRGRRRARPRPADRAGSPRSRGTTACGCTAGASSSSTAIACSTRACCSTATASSSPPIARSICSTPTLPARSPAASRSVYSAGDQVVTAETEFGRVGHVDLLRRPVPRAVPRARRAGGDDPVRAGRVPVRDRRGPLGRRCCGPGRSRTRRSCVAAAQWGTWGPARAGSAGTSATAWSPTRGARVIAEAPDGVGVTFAELDLARSGASARSALPAPPQAAARLLALRRSPARPGVRCRHVVIPG